MARQHLQHALTGHSEAVGGLLHRHQRREVHGVGEAVEIGGGQRRGSIRRDDLSNLIANMVLTPYGFRYILGV
ncbi:hypothetical protein Rwratislav_08817 [Rhodococcus wratislaviensis IFP 2016]|nr:hypothetical protein Rwratislav_08817 [Rhodococcus wratislaviensis IFP 2016]